MRDRFRANGRPKRAYLQAFSGGFQAEITQLIRSQLFLVLTSIQAIAFLLLVSLFGLTGSRAPVAVVTEDKGEYSKMFAAELAATHHSFRLQLMSSNAAAQALNRGEIVAVITVPPDFSQAVLFGKNTELKLDVDNIDTDMTDDVQRALPSAIVAFGRRLRLPDIRLRVSESDLIDHDTDYISYLVVSGLILDAFVIAGILSAMTAAREFETGTVRLLAAAPVHALAPLLGRAAAANVVACGVMVFPLAIVVLVYKIHPLHAAAALAVLLVCTTIFTCFGIVLGLVLKRTLPVTALVLGLAMPLYICSGSLEPARFDGNRLWALAHLSPVYYAVGLLEHAFHGLQVTPESMTADCGLLACWAGGMLLTSGAMLRRRLS